MVSAFYKLSAAVFGLVGLAACFWTPVLWSLVILVPLFAMGVRDSMNERRAVLRNFPVIGHFRYLLEMIRPEINQYFIESELNGTPFNREMRSISYQRAKHELQTVPFGTQRDVYEPGYEWLNHSLIAKAPVGDPPQIRIGSPACKQPYDASLLNISAMSFGALSSAAIRALNGGAQLGGFYHNTGEGGVSRHHLEMKGDLCWQIGTGYFGCRNPDGTFSPERFEKQVAEPSIKLIEIKLSQGAKPGHGGILPAAKITDEIAAIRGVSKGHDVVSPPSHSAFDSPAGLLDFVSQLRDLSGGKPVGFKLCVGNRVEFMGVVKAMVESGVRPDFITVDGGEGGTGAAPLEFTDSVGSPLTEGLVFVHNALVGYGIRDEIKLIASGKIITGFQMASRLAAGADLCNSARGFMFSLGCIQARRCNANVCPVGIATQDPGLVRGLVVENKTRRVQSFHKETVHALLEILGAAGISGPDELRPWHIHRRIDRTQIATYAEIFDFLAPGALLGYPLPPKWAPLVEQARTNSFRASMVPIELANATG